MRPSSHLFTFWLRYHLSICNIIKSRYLSQYTTIFHIHNTLIFSVFAFLHLISLTLFIAKVWCIISFDTFLTFLNFYIFHFLHFSFSFFHNLGGMFRLIKINTDKEPSLSQTLGVSGLPTVFAVNNGKLTDRCDMMIWYDMMCIQQKTYMVSHYIFIFIFILCFSYISHIKYKQSWLLLFDTECVSNTFFNTCLVTHIHAYILTHQNIPICTSTHLHTHIFLHTYTHLHTHILSNVLTGLWVCCLKTSCSSSSYGLWPAMATECKETWTTPCSRLPLSLCCMCVDALYCLSSRYLQLFLFVRFTAFLFCSHSYSSN